MPYIPFYQKLQKSEFMS